VLKTGIEKVFLKKCSERLKSGNGAIKKRK